MSLYHFTKSLTMEATNQDHESGYKLMEIIYEDCQEGKITRYGDATSIKGRVGTDVKDGKICLFAKGSDVLMIYRAGSIVEIEAVSRKDAKEAFIQDMIESANQMIDAL